MKPYPVHQEPFLTIIPTLLTEGRATYGAGSLFCKGNAEDVAEFVVH